MVQRKKNLNNIMEKLVRFVLIQMVLVIFLIASNGSAGNEEKKAVNVPGNAPDIDFSELEFDFGKVQEGPSLDHIFKFRNLGKTDLIIEEVKSS
jgi:hypothetical protein